MVRKNIFHIGLACKDTALDVLAVLEKEGLVTGDARKAAPPAEGSGITFDMIREAVANMHSFDQAVLTKAGLDALSKTHRAYPILFQGKSLVVLLLNDLRPRDAAKLELVDAMRRVRIMVVDKGQGRTLWPVAANE